MNNSLFRYLIMFLCSVIIFIIGFRLIDGKKILSQALGMIMSAISMFFILISGIAIGVLMIN